MQETLLNTKKSQELYERALQVIPGGVNSPVRSFNAVNLSPLFISKAKGQNIWDEDQNQYIDYVMSWGALIHGHAKNEIITSIEKSLSKGTNYGAPHEKEIELAEIIVEKFESVEKVRLVNSGTEAVMTALRLARAYTKRNKIIKFSGCYHGHSDSVLSNSGSGIVTLGIPSCPGVRKNTASETITLPYNDIHALDITLSKYPKDIAAVIVEPVIGNCGVILPNTRFLNSLKDLTRKFKCVLIFDEVITGFRLSSGGAQKVFGISADLTTFGKIIGGGMPIGAIGGKKEIMDLLAPVGPVYQAGTMCGNIVSVTSGLTTLKLLNDENYKSLEELTETLCKEIENINKEKSISGIQVNRIGSMFTIFFSETHIQNYEATKKANKELFAKFYGNMLSNGIYLAPSQFEANFLSLAHKEQDIEKTVEAYKKSIEAINLR